MAFRFRPFLLMLLCVSLFGAVSCFGPDDPDNPDDPETPDNPIKSGDYQSVPTSGGTIKLGDISVTFPKSAFPSETKVAITELPKGTVLGEDEVSKFYQLTLPPQIGKSFTVTIQCEEQGNDLNVVVQTPSLRISERECTVSETLLKSSYKNGAYTVTLPETDNADVEEEKAQLPVTIGVGRMEYCGKQGVSKAADTRAAVFEERYTEGNVSWHFNFSRSFKQAYFGELAMNWEEINNTIREAIKYLHGLGLEVTTRDIGMSFADLGDPDGTFAQSPVCNEWSTVAFHTKILKDFNGFRDKFRRSAIHELMHVFQADYDSRSAYNKAGGLNGVLTGGSYLESDELLLLYESGAVWSEQFMGGSFSTSFASDFIPGFFQGFDDVAKIWENDGEATTRHKRYQFHGYGASTLMQYITKQMKSYKLNDKSITDLYKIWKNTNYWFSKDGPKNCIKDLTSGKGRDLFSLDHYDDFLLSLAEGELIPDFNVSKLYGGIAHGKINDQTHEAEHSGTCYVYGGLVEKFMVNVEDVSLLKKKTLVIDQKNEGVQTYVLFVGSKGKAEKMGYKAWKDSPTVIPNEDFIEQYRKSEGKGVSFTVFTITTTQYNRGTLESRVKVSLQDEVSVEPTELHFGPDGGTRNVKFNYGTYKRYGAKVRAEGHGWCGVQIGDGVSIDIIVQPNTTDQARECIVDCYVTNEQNPTEDQMVIMPVTVKQDASQEPAGQNLKVGVISFQSKTKAQDHWSSWTEDEGNRSGVSESVRDHSFQLTFADEVEKSMTATLSGTTIHAKAEYTEVEDDGSTYHATISFKINGFSGDYKKCTVSDIAFYAKNGDGSYVSSINISLLPVVTYVRKTEYTVWLWFEATEAQGLQVASLNDHTEWEGVNFKGHGQDNYSYVSDKDNKATLDFRFDPPAQAAAPEPLPEAAEAAIR